MTLCRAGVFLSWTRMPICTHQCHFNLISSARWSSLGEGSYHLFTSWRKTNILNERCFWCSQEKIRWSNQAPYTKQTKQFQQIVPTRHGCPLSIVHDVGTNRSHPIRYNVPVMCLFCVILCDRCQLTRHCLNTHVVVCPSRLVRSVILP